MWHICTKIDIGQSTCAKHENGEKMVRRKIFAYQSRTIFCNRMRCCGSPLSYAALPECLPLPVVAPEIFTKQQ